MTTSLDSFVDDVSALVSPPEIWLRLNEIMNSPRTSASDVAQVVSRDPAMTAKLLKVVNSPYYNFPARVDTISRAITILGTNELFSLATAVAAAKVFTDIPNNLVKPSTFWRHSLCTAIAARRLAETANVLHPERLYVAGLLHDVGSLLLYKKFPDKAAMALMAANGDEEIVYGTETETFGFNHAQVGAELLRLWHLPSALITAVKFHHDPALADSDALDASLIHIANVISNRLSWGAFTEEAPSSGLLPDPLVWRITGLSLDALDTVAEGLNEEVPAAVAVLLPEGSQSR